MTVRLLAAPHTNPNSKSCITGSVVEASMLHVLSYCIKWPEVQHSTGILWSTAVTAVLYCLCLSRCFSTMPTLHAVPRQPKKKSKKETVVPTSANQRKLSFAPLTRLPLPVDSQLSGKKAAAVEKPKTAPLLSGRRTLKAPRRLSVLQPPKEASITEASNSYIILFMIKWGYCNITIFILE